MRISFTLPKLGGLLRALLLRACACARFLRAWCVLGLSASLLGAGNFIFADGWV